MQAMYSQSFAILQHYINFCVVILVLFYVVIVTVVLAVEYFVTNSASSNWLDLFDRHASHIEV